jgi:hypothetical protein
MCFVFIWEQTATDYGNAGFSFRVVVKDKMYINRLKPTGHVMHHQFNIQQL